MTSEHSGPTTENPIPARPGAARRVWRVFRAAGIALVLGVLLALLAAAGAEALLRARGYGHGTAPYRFYTIEGQRYAGLNMRFFQQVFGSTDDAYFSMPPERLIALPKPPGVYRVFLFGGSAAHGWFFPHHGVGPMLEAMLGEALPGKRVEVHVCAFHAMNSHVMARMAEACRQLEPDLFVVYLGNNEVVGPFGVNSRLGRNRLPAAVMGPLIQWRLRLGDSRLLQWLTQQSGAREAVPRVWTAKPIRSMEDPRLRRIWKLYARNLESIARAAHGAGADALLCTVATNVRDWTIRANPGQEHLAPAEGERRDRFVETGLAAMAAGQFQAALEAFRKAEAIEERDIAVQRGLGECLLALHRPEEAAPHFWNLRDMDVNLASANGASNDIVRAVAGKLSDAQTWLVDTEAHLTRHSPGGMPGFRFFYDHCHLTVPGNYRLAQAMTETLADARPELGFPPREVWRGRLTFSHCRRLLGCGDAALHDEIAQVIEHLDVPTQEASAAHWRAKGAALAARVGESHEAALHAGWAAAVELRPHAVYPRVALHDLLMRQGKWGEALAQSRSLWEQAPHNWRHIQRHAAALRQSPAGEAPGPYYRKLAAWWPGFTQSWLELGGYYHGSRQYAEAAAAYAECLALQPRHPQAHAMRILSLHGAGHAGEAREALRHAEALGVEIGAAVRQRLE